MDDYRNDTHLKHYIHRCARPTNQKNGTCLQFVSVCDGAQFKDQNTAERWIHIGTSPQISTMDKIQARKRFQTYMADS